MRIGRVRVVGLAVTVAAGTMMFVPPPARAATATPSPRFVAAMAADPAAGTVAMFGGYDDDFATAPLDDTWAWGGTAWSNRGVSPFSRYGASMAYDGARGRVLLFGGSEGNGHFNENDETFTWDPVAGQWTEEVTPLLGSTPPARANAAMAYDAATGTIVLFGGYAEQGSPALPTDPSPVMGDTWVWNGSTRTWTEHTPAVSPPARSGASMVYDEVSGKVLLFGSFVDNDTWSWDGTARTWTKESPSVRPPRTSGAAMAYHAASGKAVLFGGYVGDGDITNATWTWNGATGNWARETPLVSPNPRWSAAMAYHAGTGNAVLFGGDDENPPSSLGDTWLWDGARWVRGAGPAITIGDVSLVEGDEGRRNAEFTVTLSEPSATTVKVRARTSCCSGESGLLDETVVFPAGVTSRTVAVPVWGDTEDEPDHRFRVSLTDPVGAIVYDNSGLGTILDNDPPAAKPRVGVGDASVHEGDAGVRAALFVVTLSRSLPGSVTVAYATSAGSAAGPGDFTPKSGSLHFSSGVTSLTVKVPVAPDTLLEGDETFALTLSSPSGAKISRATGVGTVMDDD